MKKINSKKMKQFHNIFVICSWVIFCVSLVKMLSVYDSLPEEIGVHFGPDGNFDVISDKRFAFYPYIVSFIMLIFCELSCFLVEKLKTGIKISDKGETQLRIVMKAFVDVFRVGIIIFFSGIWANSVIKQQAMNQSVGMVAEWIYLILCVMFFAALILIIAVNKGVRE